LAKAFKDSLYNVYYKLVLVKTGIGIDTRMIKNVKMGTIEVKSQCNPIENRICILAFTEGAIKYKK